MIIPPHSPTPTTTTPKDPKIIRSSQKKKNPFLSSFLLSLTFCQLNYYYIYIIMRKTPKTFFFQILTIEHVTKVQKQNSTQTKRLNQTKPSLSFGLICLEKSFESETHSHTTFYLLCSLFLITTLFILKSLPHFSFLATGHVRLPLYHDSRATFFILPYTLLTLL